MTKLHKKVKPKFTVLVLKMNYNYEILNCSTCFISASALCL